MLHSKGAFAPFFLSLCAPRLRDDALLARAIAAFESGNYADALLAVEFVCRRFPENHIPALLRAKILQACRPELTAKAWYRAWFCAPEDPLLQDALLRAWLQSGAAASVLDLGPAFLPERCRAGTHASLLPLLLQANVSPLGACWKSGKRIEGMLFGPGQTKVPGSANAPASPTVRLIVADETSRFEVEVPSDGRRFQLDSPRPSAVWSIAVMSDAASPATPRRPQLLQGSPLVFGEPAAAAPANRAARPAPARRAPKKAVPQNPVAIIIPVYRDQARVKACLDSVLASLPQNSARSEIIVIDDASPEPALTAWLSTLAAAGRITLLRNDFNLGFIETVNRGLRQHADHDAVLLNADTLVHGDWIDRLRATLYSASDIASVTPWSNNGEITSFPQIATPSSMPDWAQLAKIDGIAAELRRTGRIADVELPACCGFAMMLRRSVLQQIGMLDGIALVRGYGEEVDWCLRARAAGYRHLAATGVFVAHSGTVSFRFEKRLRVRQNRRVITARYPHYYPEYHLFIKDDPLKAARQAVHAALEHAGSDWLARTAPRLDGKTSFACGLPTALPSSCARIAVWQCQMSATGAAKILQLARSIASQPALALRLLVIGEAIEALWHTGVIDVLPPAPAHEPALLPDSVLLGLSGCIVLLSENTQDAPTAPTGLAHVWVDDEFQPQAWLAEWLGLPAGTLEQENDDYGTVA
jgi:GT2 family glycosyltransferase